MILEICTDSIASVKAAADGGAGRIELCSALGDGGVTPSTGLMKQARAVDGLKMHVLIRPRVGDFVYDENEIQCMITDIKTAIDCGADGVVIGALRPDGTIDSDTVGRLVKAAGDCRNVTFHRAFDLCRDPFEALEQIIELGCNRVLTSGQAPSAEAGIPLLRQLNERAAGRITILPGGGVSPSNASRIISETGCTELHGSLRATMPSPMIYHRPGVAMGTPGADEYSLSITSAQLVRETIQAMTK